MRSSPLIPTWRLSEPVWHEREAGSVAVLRNQGFDAVGIIAIEGNAVQIVARAVVEPSVKPDAVPGERTIVRIRAQEVIEVREAWVRCGRRGLGWRCLLLARQIGPLRVIRDERGGREKHHGMRGWLDHSRPKQKFGPARIVVADANAASNNQTREGVYLSSGNRRALWKNIAPQTCLDGRGLKRKQSVGALPGRSSSRAARKGDRQRKAGPDSQQGQAQCHRL